VRDFERAQAVPIAAQKQPLGALSLLSRSGEIFRRQFVSGAQHISVSILHKSGRRRKQQTFVLRNLLQERFHGFQSKRKSLPHQLRIVVGGEHTGCTL